MTRGPARPTSARARPANSAASITLLARVTSCPRAANAPSRRLAPPAAILVTGKAAIFLAGAGAVSGAVSPLLIMCRGPAGPGGGRGGDGEAQPGRYWGPRPGNPLEPGEAL